MIKKLVLNWHRIKIFIFICIFLFIVFAFLNYRLGLVSKWSTSDIYTGAIFGKIKMNSEWVLITITTVYVYLTYRIVRIMKESTNISQQSIESTKEMIFEMKNDRLLRFKPYVVPGTTINCKIDGSSSKDQFIYLKNIGTGPAIDILSIFFLFEKTELKSIMIGQFSASLFPSSEEKVSLVHFAEERSETLISLFPKEQQAVIQDFLKESNIVSPPN